MAVHKYVISFCVSLELFSGKINDYWVNFWYIVVYAAMTPLGIGIGIGVTQEASPTLTGVIKKFCLWFVILTQLFMFFAGVLSSLAAGTLVYVSIFEIIQREKSKEMVSGIKQLFFIALGFMAVLLFTRYGKPCFLLWQQSWLDIGDFEFHHALRDLLISGPDAWYCNFKTYNSKKVDMCFPRVNFALKIMIPI